MPAPNNTIRLPVAAHMVQRNGQWEIDEHHPGTVYADIPVDAVVDFLVKGYERQMRPDGGVRE